MKKLKNVFVRIYHIKSLKYILVTILAVILVGFVDENSVLRHYKNQQTINKLEEEIDRYTQQLNHDQSQIRLLDSDPKAIEKIARERYFMKADDEDIFVLSDDQPEVNPISYEAAE